MARLIQVTAVAPMELKPQPRTVWLCQCGMSQNGPYCDGSHTIAQQEPPGFLCAYHPLTQRKLRQVASAGSFDLLLESIRKPRARVLTDTAPRSLIWLTSDSDLFSEVLRIRQSSALPGQPLTDACDEEADIYLLAKNGRNVATIRVNQARRGEIDCEVYYPSAILKTHRDWVGSASRLVRDQLAPACPGDIKFFFREVWRHQFQMGIRLDLINCHEEMESLYLRLGYRRVVGSHFLHPRLATPSLVMLLVADPRGGSPIASAFQSPEVDRSEIARLYTALPPLDAHGRAHRSHTQTSSPLSLA